MQLINNNTAEQKKKNTEKFVKDRPTIWEWGTGSLLNYVCYGKNKLVSMERTLPPRATRTKGVPGRCAAFTQHELVNSLVMADVAEGVNHTYLWKINLRAVTQQWFRTTFGSGSS